MSRRCMEGVCPKNLMWLLWKKMLWPNFFFLDFCRFSNFFLFLCEKLRICTTIYRIELPNASIFYFLVYFNPLFNSRGSFSVFFVCMWVDLYRYWILSSSGVWVCIYIDWLCNFSFCHFNLKSYCKSFRHLCVSQ